MTWLREVQSADPSLSLEEHAHVAIIAGVVLTAADWSSMDTEERCAFAVAGKREAVNQAIRIGMAASGMIANVRAEIDGGESLRSSVLSSIVDRVALESERRDG